MILCEAGWPSGLRRQSPMQEVEGSNSSLGKNFFSHFFSKTDYKSLYREQGTPCTDYREAPVQITVKPPVGITGNPCTDFRETPVWITGNTCTDYRETPVSITGKPPLGVTGKPL